MRYLSVLFFVVSIFVSYDLKASSFSSHSTEEDISEQIKKIMLSPNPKTVKGASDMDEENTNTHENEKIEKRAEKTVNLFEHASSLMNKKDCSDDELKEVFAALLSMAKKDHYESYCFLYTLDPDLLENLESDIKIKEVSFIKIFREKFN